MTDSTPDPFFDDPFFEVYDRQDIAYGLVPSAAVAGFLDQFASGGKALDLGAGAGRDSLALAKNGFHVTAVDLSDRGLARIRERATEMGVEANIQTVTEDVRKLTIPTQTYDAIIATTVLDHIPADDARAVWDAIVGGLTAKGVLFVEVHSTSDPASPSPPGCHRDLPVSETAGVVINYFAPNQLVSWATEPASNLRVLRYEERQEWDYTHGPEHAHGKAILLAARAGADPDWYGQPAAFPRKN